MSGYSGYMIVFDEDQRSDWLQETGGWRGTFSDALSARDWAFKDYEVCLISFGGKAIDMACLGRRGNIVATVKYRVNFSTFVDIEVVPVSDIESRLNTALRHHFTRSASGRGNRVPPATWDGVIGVLKALRPASSDALDNLMRLREGSRRIFTGSASEVVGMERDAVGVALDIFDPSKQLRKTTLSRWAPPKDSLPPFLDGVTAIRLTEEQMLSHDANVFPAGKGVATSYGRRFEIAGRALDVIYFNRTSVEKTLGVDLIYYNHTFDAYTLIQYKRMIKESLAATKPDSSVFRPNSDSGFAKEMQRMVDFRSAVPDEWDGAKEWRAYRLNGDGFFFKLCPTVTLELLSSDLVKGMYLPREYVDSLLRSEITDGPKDGKLLSYENVKRHLSNTDFTSLVEQGWIGTRGIATQKITEIIRQSLNADRAVIHAQSMELVEESSE